MTNCSTNGNSSDCSTSSSSSSSSSSIALNTNMKTNSLSLNSPNGGGGKATSAINNLNSNSDMSSANTAQVTHSQVTEKPAHYTYLKGFRVEQCSLFLQHKCTQHRPYTCFYWHFKNQRRRRPLRKRDGTFNYNPDTYCDKYDEQSGVCPNSDDCHFVHRNAGDTEKRYHLRYYKTATCIHETDAKGNCTKNGVHCAFAHGAADMRPPVYDIRELQPQQQSSSLSVSSMSSSSSNSQQLQTINTLTGNTTSSTSSSNTFSYTNGIAANTHENSQQNSPAFNTQTSTDLMNEKTLNLSSSLEKERLLNEDPKWNDTAYVLNNYKTEQCRRPPRLCRQGFACPQYHNARDKRRNPSLYKYRSTPCPNVKQGDDWLEPTVCENGDLCKYCHSRTEQQFHPEIYKSSKCNDMISTGYCPRGPFCAFAHIEQELKNQRAHSNSESSNSDYTLENFISNAMPNNKENDHEQNTDNTATGNLGSHQTDDYNNYVETTTSHVESSSSTMMLQNGTKSSKSSNLIIQQQMLTAANTCSYNKPIGSERERPKSQMAQQQIQSQQQQQQQQQSNQLESDNNTSLKNQSINGTSNHNSQQTSSSNNNNSNTSSNSSSSSNNNNNTSSSSSTNTSNTNTILNEIEHNNNSTIEKLRHDLFRQAEVSNKLETLCLQYRQWVEKLTIDVNEWKAKYIRCETEKKNLEVQLFNKLSLEQSIAPLRNANFNLNGNSNDLIDGNDLTKLLSFNSNNNNNSNINSNSLNNKINGINKK